MIDLRRREIKSGAGRFLEGEEAYERLSRAKKFDQLNKAHIEGKIALDPNMFNEYFKEIMEGGGTPSLSEI